MTNQTPSVIVSLSPAGTLVMHLPGANGGLRAVPMRDSETAATLHRVLAAQFAAHYSIGEDGAPTQGQVAHWERHGIFPDSRCAFCVAEGRAKPHQSSRVAPRVVAKIGQVTVRHLPARNGSRRANCGLAECGL